MSDEKPTILDEASQNVQDAIMISLEAKFTAFMTRAEMINIEPEDRAALRAAFFLGVASGMQMSAMITGTDDDGSDDGSDHVEELASSTDED